MPGLTIYYLLAVLSPVIVFFCLSLDLICSTNEFVKIQTPVKFSATLDMAPFSSQNAQYLDLSIRPTQSALQEMVKNGVTEQQQADWYKSADPSTSDRVSEWSCAVCTFRNSGGSVCTMCDGQRVSKCTYQLTAVVRHLGASPANGHFICDSAHQSGDAHECKWQRCNDTNISCISEVILIIPYLLFISAAFSRIFIFIYFLAQHDYFLLSFSTARLKYCRIWNQLIYYYILGWTVRK